MNTRIFLIAPILCIYLTSFAQTGFKVSYSLPIVQSTMSDDTSYHEHVTYDIWENVITQMIDAASKGDLRVYDSLGTMIPINEIHKNNCTDDTIIEFNPNTLQETTRLVYDCVPLDEIIRGFCMKEDWTIQNNGMITKKINEYALLYHTPKEHQKLAFWIHPGSVTPDHQTATIRYNFDLHHFETPKDSAAFISALMDRILSGEVVAYHEIYDDDGPKLKLLNKTEIENSFKPYTDIDTMVTVDPIALTENMTINKRIGQTKIDQIKFTEDWMIDSKGNFVKQVREYRLMRCYYDDKGVLRGWMSFLIVRPKQ